MRNLYDVLGVPKSADQAAIKKSYKALAREWHPDRNKAPEAEQRFKEVSAAYEVLGDEKGRANYDEFGEASLKSGFNPEQARAWSRAGYNGQYADAPGSGGASFDDLFSDLFGRRGRGGRGPSPQPRRKGPEAGPDLRTHVDIDLLKAVRGGEISLRYRRPTSCGTCAGEGGSDKSTCPGCRGTGRQVISQFGFQSMIRCEVCGGSGESFVQECETCAGTGRGMEETSLKVKIPAGVSDGKTMRLRKQGGDGIRGGLRGDLYLTLNVGDDERLRREGQNLYLEVPLTLSEAVLGAKVEVPTPAGTFKVSVPPHSANGAQLRLRGKGVPATRKAKVGDLYLVLRPAIPAGDAPELEELVKQLDAYYDDNVRAALDFTEA